jgi:hypothetical protein
MKGQNIEQLLRQSGAIVRLQGREYLTYRGLLYVAHEQGLESIDVDLLSYDAESNFAIVKATVKGTRGTFTDIGDASPMSVNKMISSACVRMASTRAQGRALRQYLGVGITSVEELPGTRSAEPVEPSTPPAFNFEKAVQWSLDIGAFTEFDDAMKAARGYLTDDLSDTEKRKLWREICKR